MKKLLGATLAGTLYHMCKSGLFYANPTWVISLRSSGMDVKHVASIWKIMMSPHDIDMKDISNAFFDAIMGNSTHEIFFLIYHPIVHDHHMDEQEINEALREEVHVVVDGDEMDAKSYDLQHVWMAKATHEGVVEARLVAALVALLLQLMLFFLTMVMLFMVLFLQQLVDS